MTVAELEVLTGDLEGRRYEVAEDEFVIGRASTCDLVIPKKYISREHALIRREGDAFAIETLSIKNPVVVDDRDVDRQPLADGDEFELCGIRFRFGLAARERAATASGFGSSAEGPATGRSSFSGSGDDGWRDVSGSDSGRVVMSVDPDEDESDDTAELAVGAALGSRASFSGSTVGVGAELDLEESSSERTAALKAAVNRDDPDYDPFSEVDAAGQPAKKKSDPATERMLQIVSIVGLAGIALALFLQSQIKGEKEWTIEQVKDPIRIAVGQAILFEEQWNTKDRPYSLAETRLNGAPKPQDFITTQPPGYAEVEWVVPHVDRRSLLLIRGQAKGETAFEIRFPRTARVKVWTVLVEGIDPHFTARDARREALGKEKSPRELRRMVNDHRGTGTTLSQERDSPAKEGYYRLAVEHFRLATDAADALRSLEGQRGPNKALIDLVRECEDNEAKAERDWEDFVQREESLYQGMVNRNEPRQDCVFQLKRVLRAIGHTCDLRYKRLRVLLREAWGESLTSPPPECELDVNP